GSDKPPGAPKRGLHKQGQDTPGFIPDPVLITGPDLKTEMAGRQFAVVRHAGDPGAPRPGILSPAGLVPFKAISKAGLVGRAKVQAGVMNLQVFLARWDVYR